MFQVHAYAAQGPKTPLAPFTFQRRELGPHDVLIDIHYCGVCHSDIHQVRDEWGGALFPMVPGHEVVGKVEKVGSQVKKFKQGDAVGVGCLVDSCRKCPDCHEGLEQYCQGGATLTYNGYEKDGKTLTQGGYSTKMVTNQDFILRLPTNLPMDRVAPLLCAGITTYSPLKHWKAGPGKKVAIVGLGGLGHMAVKLAKAMGAEVSVLGRTQNKKADALKMGAHHYYATTEANTFEKLYSSFDLILNTVSAVMDWNQYINLLRRDGTMVLLGVPPESPEVKAFPLILKRRHLAGSLIGGIKETQEMLDFCGKHEIASDIELISMQKINEAYERVLKSDVKYRFVIDLKSLKK